ncbi:MAG: DUF3786 domain-containing protein, partial [Deltaproteobacteria bacterium]|nr:DUF3786 domain-containing protein [Deltaproteobacteria bacterium]
MTEAKTVSFPVALWEDLAQVDPIRAAANAGASFSQGLFVLDFLGAPFAIDTARRLVDGPSDRLRADFQRALVLLVYLAHCGRNDPPDPAGHLVGPLEIPSGAMFFRGPHAISTAPLENAYGRDPGAL